MKRESRISLLMFLLSLSLLSFFYGIVASIYRWPPYSTISDMLVVSQEATSQLIGRRPWYYFNTGETEEISKFDKTKVQPGLIKLVHIKNNEHLGVDVIQPDGTVIHNWDIEWSDIWPDDPGYLTESEIPKIKPGTHIHGSEILSDGGLLFNFDHLGLARLNACGEVVWKLQYRTHHSVFIDHDGSYWVPGQINHEKPVKRFPNIVPSSIEPVILHIAEDGKIISEKSVFELLEDNHLPGLLYMSTVNNSTTQVTGDTLHLNDIEVFSPTMKADYFQPGDIMISLRNINAILVFDSHWKLKYSLIGAFVRQHDPDFVDGNTISVFDNNNQSSAHSYSRIAVVDVISGDITTAFQGNEKNDFFTSIMGKHQWLENGNLLFSVPMKGKAMEVDKEGNIVWQYNNIISQGMAAVLEEVEQLPAKYDAGFFETARHSCQ